MSSEGKFYKPESNEKRKWKTGYEELPKNLSKEEQLLLRIENSIKKKKIETEKIKEDPLSDNESTDTRDALLEINRLQTSVRALKIAAVKVIKKNIQRSVKSLKGVPKGGYKDVTRSVDKEPPKKRRSVNKKVLEGNPSVDKEPPKKRGRPPLEKGPMKRRKWTGLRERLQKYAHRKPVVRKIPDLTASNEKKGNRDKDRALIRRAERSKFKDTEERLRLRRRQIEQAFKDADVEEYPIAITKNEGGQFTCMVCNNEYDLEIGMRRHYIYNHTASEVSEAKQKRGTNSEEGNKEGTFMVRVYKCELCEEKCYTVPNFRRHIIATHKASKEYLNKFCFVCSLCGDAFYMKVQMVKHKKNYHDIFTECPVCNEDVKTEELFKQHLKEIHPELGDKDEIIVRFEKGYFCRICGFDDEAYSTLETHIKNHSLNESYQCDFCGLKYDTVRQLETHKQRFHEEKAFCCELCGKGFVTEYSLRWHKRRHAAAAAPKDNDKRVACEKCGKTFSTPSGYKVHHMTAHENKTYECTVCGKVFTNQPNLHMHKTMVCEKDKAIPRDCPICGKTLANYILLSHHKTNIHKFGNPTETFCHLCNKTVKSSEMLVMHNNSKHTPKVDRGNKGHNITLTCAVCQSAFHNKRKMLEHYRMHREEKTFKCNSCEMVFRYPYQFYAHRKKDHPDTLKYTKIIVDSEADKKFKQAFYEAHANQIIEKPRGRKALTLPNVETQKIVNSSMDGGNNVNIGPVRVFVDYYEGEIFTSPPSATHVATNPPATNSDRSYADISIANTSGTFGSGESVNYIDISPPATEINKSYLDFLKANVSGQEERMLIDCPKVATNIYCQERIVEDTFGRDQNVSHITINPLAINQTDKSYVDFSRANVPVLGQGERILEDCPNFESDIYCKEKEIANANVTKEKDLIKENVGDLETGMDAPEDDLPYPTDIAACDYSDNESLVEDKKPFICVKQDPFEKRLVVLLTRLTECSLCEQVFANSDVYENHNCSLSHNMRLRGTLRIGKKRVVTVKKEKIEEEEVPKKQKKSRKKIAIKREQLFSCPICNEKFSFASMYVKHKQLHNKSANCLLCTEGYSTAAALVNHYVSVHNGEMTQKCPICSKAYLKYNKAGLRKHMKIKHSTEPPEIIKKVNSFPCDICGERIKGPQEFSKHLLGHSNDLYKCVLCEKELIGLVELEKHYNELHNGEMPFSCEKCSQKFPIEFRLRLHDKRTHTEDKLVRDPTDGKFACKVCGKRCTTKSYMNKHLKIHDPKHVRPRVVCELCGKSYINNYSLDIHKRTHTGEKPFACTICPDVAFASKTLLKAHTENMHKEKSHLCDICGKSYSQKRYLKGHQVYHHPKVHYNCQLCPAKFVYEDALEKHMEIHDPTRPFGCDQCNCRFKFTSNLHLHRKNVHEKMGISYPKIKKPRKRKKKKRRRKVEEPMNN